MAIRPIFVKPLCVLVIYGSWGWSLKFSTMATMADLLLLVLWDHPFLKCTGKMGYSTYGDMMLIISHNAWHAHTLYWISRWDCPARSERNWMIMDWTYLMGQHPWSHMFYVWKQLIPPALLISRNPGTCHFIIPINIKAGNHTSDSYKQRLGRVRHLL